MPLARKIYVKADKSKAEMEEYKRLGKKKDDLIKSYPSVDGNPPRVELKKGVLKIDGMEVDRYNSPQTLF